MQPPTGNIKLRGIDGLIECAQYQSQLGNMMQLYSAGLPGAKETFATFVLKGNDHKFSVMQCDTLCNIFDLGRDDNAILKNLTRGSPKYQELPPALDRLISFYFPSLNEPRKAI